VCSSARVEEVRKKNFKSDECIIIQGMSKKTCMITLFGSIAIERFSFAFPFNIIEKKYLN
jgi:hypothetical protein